MYTIYALIIIVLVITSLLYVALGRMGLFGFAEDKSSEVKGIFTNHDDGGWDN